MKSLRQLFFLFLFASFLLHSTVLYSFSNKILFDMSAYEEKVKGMLNVEVDPARKAFSVDYEVPENVNTPDDAKALQDKPIDHDELKNKLNREKLFESDPFDIDEAPQEKIQKEIDLQNPTEFPLDTPEALPSERGKAWIQENVKSDLVTPPVMKKSDTGFLGAVNVDESLLTRAQEGAEGLPATFSTGNGAPTSFFQNQDQTKGSEQPVFKNALLYEDPSLREMKFSKVNVEKGTIKKTGKLASDIDVQFQTYIEPSSQEQYVQVILNPSATQAFPSMPKDILYLIDVSGSISVTELRDVRNEIIESLRQEGGQDRFNMVIFSTEQEILYSGFHEITEEALTDVEDFVERIGGARETDIYGALMKIAPFFAESNRVLHIVFISDAKPTEGVKDYKMIINDFTQRRLGNVAFFAYDIGSHASKKFLLDYLSYENRGFAFRKDNFQNLIQLPRYLESIQSPVLYDIRIEGVEGEVIDFYPRLLPHFYEGRQSYIYAKVPKNGNFSFKLSGKDLSGDRHYLNVAIDTNLESSSEKNIPLFWARYKVYELISQVFHQGGTPEVLAEIDRLQDEFNIRISREIDRYLA